MSVYIKGMEMPIVAGRLEAVIQIHKDGSAIIAISPAEDEIGCWKEYPLIHVPDHGRLIDADALAEHKFVCVPHVIVNDKEAGAAYRLGWNTAIEAIMENAETVIGGE